MAITFVGWGATTAAGGNANAVNTGGNVTPQLPTGLQDGDLIVLFCINRNGAGATGFTATGYTSIAAFSGIVEVGLLVKRAGFTETAPTVTTTGTPGTNQPSMVLTGAWRGVDLSIEVPNELSSNTRNSATTTATTGHRFPGAPDPLLDGTLFLVVSGAQNDYTTAPGDAGGYSTLVFETTLGNDASIVAAYQIQATAAEIGEGTFGGATASAGNSSTLEGVKAAVPFSVAHVL